MANRKRGDACTFVQIGFGRGILIYYAAMKHIAFMTWAATLAIILPCRANEVLLGVANGRTSDQIADDLGISVSAVKQHIAAVCEKLNASSRSEAVTIAIRRNLLKL